MIMVLESILNPEEIEKRPVEMVVFGFIIASSHSALLGWGIS